MDCDKWEGPEFLGCASERRCESAGDPRGEGTFSKSTSEEWATGREDEPTRWTLDVIVGMRAFLKYADGEFGIPR